jgi:signal transduction histidine kinase
MKDKFISVLAHDLRGPVAGQKSLNNLILEEYDSMDDATRKEMLTNLKESSDNLYNLLNNLLDWSKAQSGKTLVSIESLNIANEISSIISEYRGWANQKNITFINNIKKDIIVKADKHLTHTILRNLISNAIKFTRKGGNVSVSTDVINNDKTDFLKINVSDNGVGINKERIQSLFKPEKANSTDGTANEKGTGLGLLLCKEFIELQNGELSVDSVINKGSTFSFTIPLMK